MPKWKNYSEVHVSSEKNVWSLFMRKRLRQSRVEKERRLSVWGQRKAVLQIYCRQISVPLRHHRCVLDQFNLLCKLFVSCRSSWCAQRTVRWKGYGQCRETEHVQWEVLPLCIPQTKYPLKHRRTQTLYPEHSSIYRRITEGSFFMPSTCHVVMHPVQHDLWGTVPAGRHVAGHLIVGVSCQTKVQNLTTI